MAKLFSNPVVGQFSGAVGEFVFIRKLTGDVFVRRRGSRTAPKRAGEEANQQRFAAAVSYAKRVWADQPELRAKYTVTARFQHQTGFALAKSDFLVPPEVKRLDLSGYTGKPGEVIRIEAVDNFEVTSVELVIRDLAGVVFERGNATRNGAMWVYTAQAQVIGGQTVVVEATAMDHPGHTGQLKADHACGVAGS